MVSQAPPAIPPRPSKSPQPTPAIPPRPPRPAIRAKPPAENASGELARQTTTPVTVELPAIPSRPAAQLRTQSSPSLSTISKSPVEGIPQIGHRVPMYPNAGDVQAPSLSTAPSSGKKKHVYREEWEMDEGAYGSKRRETPYSMSSTDLNAVVAQTTSGDGPSADDGDQGVPDEELAYLASDSYTKSLSRSHSPKVKRDSRTSFDGAEEKTDEHGNVIHLEDPYIAGGYFRRGNSVHASQAPSHHEGEEAEPEEQYSILAEDEVLKRQQGQFMQAAVHTPGYPPRHPRGIPPNSAKETRDEDVALELTTKFTRSTSKNSHRTPYDDLSPADENAKPLFPESDEEDKVLKDAQLKAKRHGLTEQRFPSKDVWEEAPNHAQLEATIENPGQEKAALPEEYDHQEEVPRRKSTDEPRRQYIRGQPHEHYQPGDEQEYERKEKDAARKDTDYRPDINDLPEDERLHRLHKRSDSDVTPSDGSMSRRGAQRRKFPSNDIWEDVPPSLDLREEIEPSPIPEKERATTGDISSVTAEVPRPTTGAPLESSHHTPKPRPAVPARPLKKFLPATIPEQPEPPVVEKKVAPAKPDRPKPHVPARPIGKLAGFVRIQEDAPEPKPKPPVPPRGKIAALKAGFMGDLESRLRLGPSAPPKKEEKKEEEEPVKEEPLTDVRKSRARGPRGRKLPTKEEKPATTTTTATTTTPPVQKGSEIVGVWTVFTLDEDLDAVVVNTTPGPTLGPALEKEDTFVVVETGKEEVAAPVAVLEETMEELLVKAEPAPEEEKKPAVEEEEEKPAAEEEKKPAVEEVVEEKPIIEDKPAVEDEPVVEEEKVEEKEEEKEEEKVEEKVEEKEEEKVEKVEEKQEEEEDIKPTTATAEDKPIETAIPASEHPEDAVTPSTAEAAAAKPEAVVDEAARIID